MTIFKISRLMIVILSLSLMSVAPPAHADSWKDATKAYSAYADDGARFAYSKSCNPKQELLFHARKLCRN